jgi:twinkle protein
MEGRITVDRTLSPLALKGLERRRICAEIASKYGVHSGSSSQPGGEVVPDANGNVLVFPYVDRGVEVAVKYRAPGKKFWQREGGRRTFWNADVLDDPALRDGRAALVITEGEFDALAVLTSGIRSRSRSPTARPLCRLARARKNWIR